MPTARVTTLGLFLLSSFSALAFAAVRQERPVDAPGAAAKKEVEKTDADKVVATDREVATQHEITLDGKKLAYTATAGTLVLREEDGKKKASIFYVAYTKNGVGDPAERALTFSFNGGPGSSSVWLHLGALGPKRVDLGSEGLGAPPPGKLVDNASSWLDFTDLVFIDPVTTGYSRAAPGEKDDEYHGVEGDVRSVAEFIRLWTTRNQRWTSPKFLTGESYGTTRAAALAEHLQTRHGMFLNGIVLVSAVLDFQTLEMDVGNDLPYALYLPTMCATAFYHHALAPELSKDLRATLAEVERFAASEYTLALARGSTLTDAERADVAAKLARFTGLAPEFVLDCNLRVGDGRFYKELLRKERRTVGRLDARFTGTDRDAAGERPEYDPSYAAIQGPYTAAANDYLRRDLKWESDFVYEILTGRVHPWKFDGADNRYLDVAERLRGAMTQNPALRVFVACGYYDLATPYTAAHYTFDHMGMDRELRARVEFGHYEAGHMLYVRPKELEAFGKDVQGFYAKALGR
ncbi:MAG: peptidase S10 [Planctomycetes bacterium]|nr:peptidase S10 [Planctomycetota bacterium]